jgi:hypothetical protein
MARVRLSTVLMVSSALVLVAANAQAGGGFNNRPDILDVNDSSSYNGSGPSSNFVWARMYADASSAGVWGSMSGSARSANYRVELFTSLWQPDSIMRNHRRAKANQKRYMYIQIGLRSEPYGGFLGSVNSIVEGCKGAMTADDKDNDGNFDLSPAGDDRIRGRLRCHRDVLEDLDISADAIDIIQGIIGNRTRLDINLP